jgi:hypothetical protein
MDRDRNWGDSSDLESLVRELAQVVETDADTASAFILHYCSNIRFERWNELKNAAPLHWTALFSLVGLRANEDFVVWWEFDVDAQGGQLLRLSVEGASQLERHAAPGRHTELSLPQGEEWIDSD